MRAHLRRRGDDGSIAVIAAVVLPVVLLVLAVAFSSLIWGASESEAQRASDSSAVTTAATTPLLELPYASLNPLAASAYPTLSQVVPSQLLSTLPTLSPCATIGNPVGAASGLLNTGGLLSSTLSLLGVGSSSTLTSAVNGLSSTVKTALASLPASCTGLGPIAPFPSVPVGAVSRACTTAEAAMAAGTAPYSTRFFSGTSGQEQPTCANGRIAVGYASGSPLVGFGVSATNGGALQLSTASGLSTVQSSLASLGVRLDSTLPNTLCPQVNVAVDQPVRGPVLPMTSTPNGRSSAVRVVKNAVVVPVFNGLALPPVTGTGLALPGADGVSTVAGSTTISAVNLNTTLLQPLQKQLIGVLDTLDAAMNQKLTADADGVAQLNGTTSAVAVTGSATLPAAGAAVAGNVGALNLLSCLRSTLRQVFDPPSGDVPTVQEILSKAAQNGEPVQLVQVGAQPCAGALDATAALSCVTAAVTPTAATALNKLTGLYDVPLLDVTPVMVRDIGNGNFLAVPGHASQADGAFRAALVRTDDRWAP